MTPLSWVGSREVEKKVSHGHGGTAQQWGVKSCFTLFQRNPTASVSKRCVFLTFVLNALTLGSNKDLYKWRMLLGAITGGTRCISNRIPDTQQSFKRAYWRTCKAVRACVWDGGCWGGGRRRSRPLDLADFTGNYHELQSHTLKERVARYRISSQIQHLARASLGIAKPGRWSKASLGTRPALRSPDVGPSAPSPFPLRGCTCQNRAHLPRPWGHLERIRLYFHIGHQGYFVESQGLAPGCMTQTGLLHFNLDRNSPKPQVSSLAHINLCVLSRSSPSFSPYPGSPCSPLESRSVIKASRVPVVLSSPTVSSLCIGSKHLS